MSTKKRVLDVYLNEVFKQYIALKDDDLKRSQDVFKSVFDQVKQKMMEQCNYFKKYSSQVMYAGSVYDGIKVAKLDEFDMDIVIRLPISYEDGSNGIIIEADQPGFIKMKITNAFDHMDKQPDWEKCHKVIREWRDSDKYFLQNKFRQWLHGIVQKALNEMNGKVTAHGETYLVTYKESGPAYTLNIKNDKGNEEFNLDVDLVPVIRFMFPCWPEGYRVIEGSQVREWLAVPKSIKTLQDSSAKSRYWRLSFQEYEREMMKGCQQLKTNIRLIKKLRDALGLRAIASYYIKTLFLWKINKVEKSYWQNKPSVIFRDMLEEFYNAVKNKRIPYFWHEENNLIENLKPTLQNLYADKLKSVLNSVIANDVDKVVAALLTAEEWKDFKDSDIYKKNSGSALSQAIGRQISIDSTATAISISENVRILNDEIDSLHGNVNDEKFKELEFKLNELTDRVSTLEQRLLELEVANGYKQKFNASEDLGGILSGTEGMSLGLVGGNVSDGVPIVGESNVKPLLEFD